jgi:hypothetical protein
MNRLDAASIIAVSAKGDVIAVMLLTLRQKRAF